MSTTNKPKLFLLDALALIYRAHFAFIKNPRITSAGLNTSATLGFTNTLVEVINREKPTHLVVAFDTPAPTYRHTVFPAYKEHRPAQPEDITVAIPYVKRILEAFHIPVLSLEGYEADDIIGTLARQAAQKGFEVYMMTPDKDFAQLVDDHIYLYKPAFMGNDVVILDRQAVLEKWGITHVDQMRDLLALQGDAVDNIPGIPSIGVKTAQKLIQQFGNLENLLANTDKLTGKLQDNIIKYAEQGILSKELATIHTEVPIQFKLEDSYYQGPDSVALRAIFQELEFNALTRRVLGEGSQSSRSPSRSNSSTQTSLFDASAATQTEAESVYVYQDPVSLSNIYTTKHQYHLIDTPALRKQLIEYLKLQDAFCFDTETTSLDPYQAELVGISFSYYPSEAYYVPIPADRESAQAIVEEFRPLFESVTQCKIGQNLKYDNLILRCYGIEVKPPTFDTMVAHYLVAPDRPHNMNAMAESYLNYAPIPIEALIGSRKATQKSMRMVDLQVVKEYACEDADITLQLKKILEKQIEKENLSKLFYEIESPLVEVLTAMEFQGVQIDTGVLQEISVKLTEELAVLEKEIYQSAGCIFNISSPKQLGEVLFDKLRIPGSAKKTKSGQYATSEMVLSDLANDYPIIANILDYRELQKLKSTYVDAFPNLISPFDKRLHTSYNQTIVTTGRLSSTNPNLQNIPIRTEKGRAIRKAFVPSRPDHVLLSADYSQIELRIMASFSQDEHMIEAFKAGKDIHTATASKLFKVSLEQVDESMRRQAKTANFGIIYGISGFGLAQRLGIPRAEAITIIQAYFQEFHAIKTYMDKVISQAREQGYVTTLMGRKRYLRDINSRNSTMRGFDERNAINTPIQGTAAEMIKLAMVHIYEWLQREKLQSKLLLQVHDELVFDVPQHEVEIMREHVAYFMENALPLAGVPVEVQIGIGKDWQEAH
jgi:DNA polymerase-1